MRSDLASPKCPTRGFVVLGTAQRDYVVPTTCKTWGCGVCYNKVRQLTALKMMYGCLSTGGPSHFITVTYRKRDRDATKNARGVAKEWAALWRLLREKVAWKNAAWIKVPELTRRGQVHLHGIIVGAIGKASCRRSEFQRKAWTLRGCSESCLEHDISRSWYEVTKGKSYITDCQEVRSVAGTCAYVQKYMAKDFSGERKALKSLGFKKRWSSSKNWPRCEPVRLQGSVVGAWESVLRVHGPKATYALHSEDEPERMSDMVETQELEKDWLMERVGEDYLLAVMALGERKRDMKDIQKGLGIKV